MNQKYMKIVGLGLTHIFGGGDCDVCTYVTEPVMYVKGEGGGLGGGSDTLVKVGLKAPINHCFKAGHCCRE